MLQRHVPTSSAAIAAGDVAALCCFASAGHCVCKRRLAEHDAPQTISEHLSLACFTLAIAHLLGRVAHVKHGAHNSVPFTARL
jgi:hypothetical protein